MAAPLFLIALVAVIVAWGYVVVFFVLRIFGPGTTPARPGVLSALACLGVTLALGMFVVVGSAAHAFFLPDWALSLVAAVFTVPSVAVCVWLSRRMNAVMRPTADPGNVRAGPTAASTQCSARKREPRG